MKKRPQHTPRPLFGDGHLSRASHHFLTAISLRVFSASSAPRPVSHAPYRATAARSAGVTGFGKPAPSGTRGVTGTSADASLTQRSGLTVRSGLFPDKAPHALSVTQAARAISIEGRIDEPFDCPPSGDRDGGSREARGLHLAVAGGVPLAFDGSQALALCLGGVERYDLATRLRKIGLSVRQAGGLDAQQYAKRRKSADPPEA